MNILDKLRLGTDAEMLIVITCIVTMGICFIKKHFGDDRKIIDVLLWIGSAGIWICILFTL